MVEIENNKLWFSTTTFGNVKAPIDKIKLNYKGVIKEFPDLENDDNWRTEAIRRFKLKIDSMESEDKVARYVIEDLRKHGYIGLFKQKKGFRPEVIKWVYGKMC